MDGVESAGMVGVVIGVVAEPDDVVVGEVVGSVGVVVGVVVVVIGVVVVGAVVVSVGVAVVVVSVVVVVVDGGVTGFGALSFTTL